MTKNHKSTKTGKFFALILTLVCFALVVSLADLFSNFLTVGSFADLLTKETKVSGYDVHAICLTQSSVLSSAEDSAKAIKLQNGAGYVWNDDGVYLVLASAYLSANDAEKVRVNLTSSYPEASIFKISIPELIFSTDLGDEERSVLSSSLTIFKSTYESLYDLSVSLDTNIMSETEIKLALADTLANVNKVKTNFESTFSAKYTQNTLQFKLKLNEVYTLVDELVDYTSTTAQSFSSKIKENYLEIIYLNSKLVDETHGSF